jgi:hypothetical protein
VKGGTLDHTFFQELPMSKRYLGAIALGAGLTFVPVTVQTSDDAATPTLVVSEACALAGECCSFYLGELCLLGDEVQFNYRPGGGSCEKLGT